MTLITNARKSSRAAAPNALRSTRSKAPSTSNPSSTSSPPTATPLVPYGAGHERPSRLRSLRPWSRGPELGYVSLEVRDSKQRIAHPMALEDFARQLGRCKFRSWSHGHHAFRVVGELVHAKPSARRRVPDAYALIEGKWLRRPRRSQRRRSFRHQLESRSLLVAIAVCTSVGYCSFRQKRSLGRDRPKTAATMRRSVKTSFWRVYRERVVVPRRAGMCAAFEGYLAAAPRHAVADEPVFDEGGARPTGARI
jgi:hypothetical protein